MAGRCVQVITGMMFPACVFCLPEHINQSIAQYPMDNNYRGVYSDKTLLSQNQLEMRRGRSVRVVIHFTRIGIVGTA
jgi:hypothetical protein